MTKKTDIRTVLVPAKSSKSVKEKSDRKRSVSRRRKYAELGKSLKRCNLLWLVDKTLSMTHLIEEAKQASTAFFERVSGMDVELNVCWCPYGDYVDYREGGSSSLLDPHRWTTDLATLKSSIAATTVVNGGDADEAVEYALAHAVNSQDSIDAIVLIGDADPHEQHEAESQTRQFGVQTNWNLDWRASARQLGQRGIPVYTFPLTGECTSVFQEISRKSGGESGSLESLDRLVDLLALSVLATKSGGRAVQLYLERYGGQMDSESRSFATKLLTQKKS